MTRPLTRWCLAVIAAVALVQACTAKTPTTEDAGTTGPVERTCVIKEDCNDEFLDCIGGICQRPCGTDDVCEFGQFCGAAGYCQAGCRDSSGCGSDQLCSDGVCRNRSEVGTCATKTDCVDPPNTKVCVSGACQSPPAMCAGPQDCPGAQQCNGFTHACFDPNGECTTTPDCATKPQCTMGCTCTMDRRCVATPTCTLETEAATCGVNSFCDTRQMPSRCGPVPTCQRQADCDAPRLACNTSTRLCQRTPTCTADSACTAPFAKCNTSLGFCQAPSCSNGGTTCPMGQVCNMDGTCGTSTQQSCTSNTDCPMSPIQYCDGATAFCKPGCRSDANCNASIGEKCNGGHVCAIPGGSSSSGGAGGGDGEACMDDSACRVGYKCGTLTGVCREDCSAGACPPCPQTGYGCFAGYCSPFATAPEDAGDGGFICQ